MPRVLITGGPLAADLAARLRPRYNCRLVGESTDGQPPGVEVVVGDIREPEFAASVTVGCDLLVHLDPLRNEGSDLERIDRATRGTYTLLKAALAAGARRVVLGSTMRLFRRMPAAWRVAETWRPRPEPEPDQLAPWMAELSAREFARDGRIPLVVCLRLGQDPDQARSDAPLPHAGGPEGPIALLDCGDALSALERALEYEAGRGGWQLFHVVSGGPRLARAARPPFEFAPARDLNSGPRAAPEAAVPADWKAILGPVAPIPSRPLRRVVIYGAGGPLAAEAARVLAPTYTLRLTDIRPIEEIHSRRERQSPHSPLPEPLPPPHEMRITDVTDPDQVNEAAAGMDAILNCTVIRPHPVDAFRVNTLGAYNIARAAVTHGIRRVVQTGPQLVALAEGAGYGSDYDVPADSPPRAADHLYGHSKYLGQEILRVFADYHDLEVPVLLFCIFVNPVEDDASREMNPFTVSWEDAAIALRRCLEVESFPSAYEVMNINADLPQGRFTNERARRLLDWQPRHRLERFWMAE